MTTHALNRRERRITEARLRSPRAARAVATQEGVPPGEMELTRASFNLLRSLMEAPEYGNKLSDKHAHALRCLLGRYSAIASGRHTGRWAFDLDTGGGKSLSVAAWCATVHAKGLPYSVLIAATRVEELCKMKRRLVELGVPEDEIGLWYSDRKVKEASEPRTPEEDHPKKKYLLVTHARIRGGTDLEKMNTYQAPGATRGKERSIAFYDESLLVSESRTLKKINLKSCLAYITEQAEAVANGEGEVLREALAYIRECIEVLDNDTRWQEWTEAGNPEADPPAPIALPERSGAAIERYEGALDAMYFTMKDVDRRAMLKPLRAFLAMSQCPIRVVSGIGGGDACITYDIVVPAGLNRLVVLDASWPIRELERLDPGIQHDPTFDGRIKSYRNVVLRSLRVSGGRGALEQSFAEPLYEDRLLSREVVHLVTEVIPEDESVLIFCHKQQTKNDVDIPTILRADFDAAGVSRDRVSIETWGMETGLNDYSHVKHVVLLGMLFQNEADIAGQMIGQQANYGARVGAEDVLRVINSEAAHHAYQALSRGQCRITRYGMAGAMTGWLVNVRQEILDYLAEAMPDVDAGGTWRAQYVTEQAKGRLSREAADAIVAYLNALAEDVTSVSVRALKQALLWLEVTEGTFTTALDLALRRLSGWRRQGRSVVRVVQATSADPYQEITTP